MAASLGQPFSSSIRFNPAVNSTFKSLSLKISTLENEIVPLVTTGAPGKVEGDLLGLEVGGLCFLFSKMYAKCKEI